MTTIIKYLKMASTWRGLAQLVGGILVIWLSKDPTAVNPTDILGGISTLSGLINTLKNS